jgi:probable HAF family extracellular repeat protein
MERQTAFSHLLAILLLATFGTAQKYTVTDLGTFGGNISYASSVNASGQVIGSSYISKWSGIYHAFIWTAATGLQDLGTWAATTVTPTRSTVPDRLAIPRC